MSETRDPSDGSAVSAVAPYHSSSDDEILQCEPPTFQASQLSTSILSPSTTSCGPTPFSSLYFPDSTSETPCKAVVTSSDLSAESASAWAPPPTTASAGPNSARTSACSVGPAVAETKAALPRDSNKGGSEDGEPPPPYTEGPSPLESFSYLLAAAGGASSIITQVQQGGPPPISTLAGTSARVIGVVWHMEGLS